MSDEKKTKGGSSCVGCLLVLFVVWAVIFGLPTPWGAVHLDIFPPAIRVVE